MKIIPIINITVNKSIKVLRLFINEINTEGIACKIKTVPIISSLPILMILKPEREISNPKSIKVSPHIFL
jgi:hypothetical protein